MNEKQIANRLAEIEGIARADHGMVPDMFKAMILPNGTVTAHGYNGTSMTRRFSGRGATFREALDGLEAEIRATGTVEERKRQEAAEAIAKAIEAANAAGLAVEYVNPLREAMKRLSENALTHEADQ